MSAAGQERSFAAEPAQPFLVPLDTVRVTELDPLLDDESACWARALDWDFSHTAELIRRSVEAGSVQGCALRSPTDGHLLAYGYYILNPDRSHIGTVHALPDLDAAGAASAVLDRCLVHLTSGATRRVESQFLHFGTDDLEPVFGRHGFRQHPRQFLSGNLDEILTRLGPIGHPEGLAPFRFGDTQEIARIIYASFIGSVDAEMSSCYASLDGCVSFVEGVALRNGCGRFDPNASFVTLGDHGVIGVVLTSRIGRDVGHIVQISVAPSAQKRGVGRRLLARSCEALREQGARRLSLSVSTENTSARRWYRALGLEPVKDFSASVWTDV